MDKQEMSSAIHPCCSFKAQKVRFHGVPQENLGKPKKRTTIGDFELALATSVKWLANLSDLSHSGYSSGCAS